VVSHPPITKMFGGQKSKIGNHQMNNKRQEKTQEQEPSQELTGFTPASFQEFLREKAREALAFVIEAEVESLCGRAYHPDCDSPYTRAGSAQSYAIIDGRREAFKRPRVRYHDDTGSHEYSLKGVGLAQSPEQWEDAMYRAVLSGVSTRDMPLLRGESLAGESRSNLSRLWQRKSAELVGQVQKTDLSGVDLLVLVLDAVHLANSLVATVALGIDTEGYKHVLGFLVGSSENKEVCSDLLANLTGRGLSPGPCRKLFAVLDGSKALENALLLHFPDALVQRCLVHKERNIKGYLPQKYWGELAGLFKGLRESQGNAAGREALEKLKAFLVGKNANAGQSLEEAGESLLALHSLDVPIELHKPLLSTNCIENLFRNLRRHIGRVCRWHEGGDQADRWLASGLSLASSGFHRLKGFKELGKLAKALEHSKEPQVEAKAA
jgi:putative transposase